MEDGEDRGDGRVREDCMGRTGSVFLQERVAREGRNTLNVVPGPFATRSALRGHGQLRLDVFFHLETHQVSSRSRLRWMSRDLLT